MELSKNHVSMRDMEEPEQNVNVALLNLSPNYMNSTINEITYIISSKVKDLKPVKAKSDTKLGKRLEGTSGKRGTNKANTGSMQISSCVPSPCGTKRASRLGYYKYASHKSMQEDHACSKDSHANLNGKNKLFKYKHSSLTSVEKCLVNKFDKHCELAKNPKMDFNENINMVKADTENVELEQTNMKIVQSKTINTCICKKKHGILDERHRDEVPKCAEMQSDDSCPQAAICSERSISAQDSSTSYKGKGILGQFPRMYPYLSKKIEQDLVSNVQSLQSEILHNRKGADKNYKKRADKCRPKNLNKVASSPSTKINKSYNKGYSAISNSVTTSSRPKHRNTELTATSPKDSENLQAGIALALHDTIGSIRSETESYATARAYRQTVKDFERSVKTLPTDNSGTNSQHESIIQSATRVDNIILKDGEINEKKRHSETNGPDSGTDSTLNIFRHSITYIVKESCPSPVPEVVESRNCFSAKIEYRRRKNLMHLGKMNSDLWENNIKSNNNSFKNTRPSTSDHENEQTCIVQDGPIKTSQSPPKKLFNSGVQTSPRKWCNKKLEHSYRGLSCLMENKFSTEISDSHLALNETMFIKTPSSPCSVAGSHSNSHENTQFFMKPSGIKNKMDNISDESLIYTDPTLPSTKSNESSTEVNFNPNKNLIFSNPVNSKMEMKVKNNNMREYDKSNREWDNRRCSMNKNLGKHAMSVSDFRTLQTKYFAKRSLTSNFLSRWKSYPYDNCITSRCESPGPATRKRSTKSLTIAKNEKMFHQCTFSDDAGFNSRQQDIHTKQPRSCSPDTCNVLPPKTSPPSDRGRDFCFVDLEISAIFGASSCVRKNHSKPKIESEKSLSKLQEPTARMRKIVQKHAFDPFDSKRVAPSSREEHLSRLQYPTSPICLSPKKKADNNIEIQDPNEARKRSLMSLSGNKTSNDLSRLVDHDKQDVVINDNVLQKLHHFGCKESDTMGCVQTNTALAEYVNVDSCTVQDGNNPQGFSSVSRTLSKRIKVEQNTAEAFSFDHMENVIPRHNANNESLACKKDDSLYSRKDSNVISLTTLNRLSDSVKSSFQETSVSFKRDQYLLPTSCCNTSSASVKDEPNKLILNTRSYADSFGEIACGANIETHNDTVCNNSLTDTACTTNTHEDNFTRQDDQESDINTLLVFGTSSTATTEDNSSQNELTSLDSRLPKNGTPTSYRSLHKSQNDQMSVWDEPLYNQQISSKQSLKKISKSAFHESSQNYIKKETGCVKYLETSPKENYQNITADRFAKAEENVNKIYSAESPQKCNYCEKEKMPSNLMCHSASSNENVESNPFVQSSPTKKKSVYRNSDANQEFSNLHLQGKSSETEKVGSISGDKLMSSGIKFLTTSEKDTSHADRKPLEQDYLGAILKLDDVKGQPNKAETKTKRLNLPEGSLTRKKNKSTYFHGSTAKRENKTLHVLLDKVDGLEKRLAQSDLRNRILYAQSQNLEHKENNECLKKQQNNGNCPQCVLLRCLLNSQLTPTKQKYQSCDDTSGLARNRKNRCFSSVSDYDQRSKHRQANGHCQNLPYNHPKRNVLPVSTASQTSKNGSQYSGCAARETSTRVDGGTESDVYVDYKEIITCNLSEHQMSIINENVQLMKRFFLGQGSKEDLTGAKNAESLDTTSRSVQDVLLSLQEAVSCQKKEINEIRSQTENILATLQDNMTELANKETDINALKEKIDEMTPERDTKRVLHEITRQSLYALKRDHEKLWQEYVMANCRRYKDKEFLQNRLLLYLNNDNQSFDCCDNYSSLQRQQIISRNTPQGQAGQVHESSHLALCETHNEESLFRQIQNGDLILQMAQNNLCQFSDKDDSLDTSAPEFSDAKERKDKETFKSKQLKINSGGNIYAMKTKDKVSYSSYIQKELQAKSLKMYDPRLKREHASIIPNPLTTHQGVHSGIKKADFYSKSDTEMTSSTDVSTSSAEQVFTISQCTASVPDELETNTSSSSEESETTNLD